MTGFSFKMAGFSFKIADFSFKRACLLQMVLFGGGPPLGLAIILKTVLSPYKEFGQKFGPVILENLASKTCIFAFLTFWASKWSILASKWSILASTWSVLISNFRF